jgi:hypothetical protein
VVVLPEPPAAADLETMLGLMGWFGEATGQPVTRVRFAGPRDLVSMADADLLVLGAAPGQSLLDTWADAFPVPLSPHAPQAWFPMGRVAAVYDWLRYGAPPAQPGPPAKLEGAGPLAAIYGFESPVTAGRSVVAITAVVPEQMSRVLDALDNADRRREIGGSAAFVLPWRVESVRAGRTYATGFLPPWAEGGSWLSARWLVLVAAAGLVMLAVAFAAWRVRRGLRLRAARGSA